MKDKSTNQKRLPVKMVLIGLGLAVLFWILHAIIEAYVFHEGDLFKNVLLQDLPELWEPLLIVCLLIGFGIYSQAIISRRKRAEEALQKARNELEMRVETRTSDLTTANEEVQIESTERRRIDEAIREAEKRYKAIFDNQIQMVYINDEQGLFLDANDYGLERVGYTRDDLGKLRFQDILHPEDLPKAFESVTDILAKGRMEESIELRLVTKSGEIIWVETFNIPLERGVDHYVGLGIAYDITERKRMEEELRESEEHYSALVSNLTEAVFKIKGGAIVWCNGRVEEICGYKVNEMIGKNVSFFYPGNISASEFNNAVLRGMKEHGHFHSITKFQKTDGNTVDIEYSVSQIPGKDPIELVVVARDITEQVQADEEIRRLNEVLEQRVVERTTQLEVVNKELETFAYSVSHDLRAPLRSIDGFSQVLLEDYADKVDAQGKDYLQRVRSASQRMAQLIDDILNLSRVTRGEMHHETVDLSALALTIAMELQQSQSERQVEFIITPGLVTEGDAHLLQVVLQNLLGNAWKFTGTHEHATIEFGYTETNGRPAYFIRDDGVGFDMAYSDKLFGAFQRLHSPNEFEGTGIGLATVQRVVNRHSGDVWAESAIEQGATFYFTL